MRRAQTAAVQRPPTKTAICPECGTKRFMEFECVSCCIKWLSQMTREEIKYNAPMIERVAGIEQMKKVREAWKTMR